MDRPKTIFLDVDDVLNCLTPAALNFIGCRIGVREYSMCKPEWGYNIIAAAQAMLPNAVISVSNFWERFPQKFWTYLPLSEESTWLPRICADFVGKENVCLLTKPTGVHGCVEGKIEWIRRVMPHWLQNQYLIGQPKRACAHPGAVLIDDYSWNIASFIRSGGRAITIPRPWNSFHNVNCQEHVQSKLESMFRSS